MKKSNPVSCRRAVVAVLATLLMSSFSIMATDVEAAHIDINPGAVTITMLPGEGATIPFSSTLNTARGDFAKYTFKLSSKDNVMGPWLTSSPISLDKNIPSMEGVLTVSVPEGTPGGGYTTSLSPALSTRTSTVVTSGEMVITIDVPVTASCVDAPSFLDISATTSVVQAKNNKPYPIEFSGQIAAGENCTLEGAWYELTDEYGEYETDGPQPLTSSEDGSFSATVTILASRNGKDKDGRLYTVVFSAANETGKADSNPMSIVVAHDNGKK